MKNLMHKYKFPKMLALSAVMLSFLLVHYLTLVSAATGTIALSSNASSVVINNQFVVTVTANTDEGVSVAEAKVVYNKAAVSVVGVDYAGSPFDNRTPAANPSGDGFVYLSSFTAAATPPSGSNLIGKITFKAIKDVGDAGISTVKADSGLYNTGGNILTSAGSVAVALKPVPTTPPTNNPTSPPASGGGASTTSGSSGMSGGSLPATVSDGNISSDTGSRETASDTPGLEDGSVGTQPPEGSISEPLMGDNEIITKKSGVDGLSIEQYRKQATIGITAAILLGGAGYVFFFLRKKNSFLHHKPSVAGANAVVFDGNKHSGPSQPPVTPSQPTTPSNIITPQHKDQ